MLDELANKEHERLTHLSGILAEAVVAMKHAANVVPADQDSVELSPRTFGSPVVNTVDVWLETNWRNVTHQATNLVKYAKQGIDASKTVPPPIDVSALALGFEAVGMMAEVCGMNLQRPVTEQTGELGFEMASLLEALPHVCEAATRRVRGLNSDKMAVMAELEQAHRECQQSELQMKKLREVPPFQGPDGKTWGFDLFCFAAQEASAMSRSWEMQMTKNNQVAILMLHNRH